MKTICVFAVLLALAASAVHAEDDSNKDLIGKIPASVVLEAAKAATEAGMDFYSAGNVIAAVEAGQHPLSYGLLPKCNNGECRKKCNAKGENGACLWFKCICWK